MSVAPIGHVLAKENIHEEAGYNPQRCGPEVVGELVGDKGMSIQYCTSENIVSVESGVHWGR